MESILEQTISKLEGLRKHIIRSDINKIYLLCGNAKGGKKTLAHYMNEAEIIFEVDEEGQDVLTVRQEMQTIKIVEGVLQIMPCPDKQTLFIKLTSFLSPSKSPQQHQEYSLTLDYLLLLLSHNPNSCSIKLILILSQQQLQEDDELFIKYHTHFKSIPDYIKRSYIVLSKIVDEDQFNQFVEITSQNIIEAHQECSYLKEIIGEGRVYGFYSRDVDQDQRYQFNQNVSSGDVAEKMGLEDVGVLVRKVMHEYAHELHDKLNSQLKIALQIINTIYINLLFKSIKSEQPTTQKHEKQAYSKLYNKQLYTKLNASISEKKKQEQFIKKYEEMYEMAKSKPQQLVGQIYQLVQFLYSYVVTEGDAAEDNQAAGVDVLARFYMLCLLYNGVVDKPGMEFFRDPEFCNLFTNHDDGAFDQHCLAKVFVKIKPLLSQQFAKAHQKLASSSPKKKTKKAPQKPSLPDYDQQRKIFLSKPKKLSQLLQLAPSPLQVDLLLDELDRIRKNKQRTISEEKKIIKQVIQTLKLYQCHEESVMLACVVPDYFEVLVGVREMIKKGVDKKNFEFIIKICQFFVEGNRVQYIKQIISSLQSSGFSASNLIQNLTNLSKKTGSQANAKHFLNYDHITQTLLKPKTRREQLIQKCILFEAENMETIEKEMIKKWILTSNEVKIN